MRQVVQRRKRCSVRQSRRGLDDARFAVRAAVRDLEDTAGLAAQLPRDGVEIRRLNHRAAGRRGGGNGRRASGLRRRRGVAGETPCGASAMVCHSDVYHGWPLGGGARHPCPARPAPRPPGGNCTW